MFEPVRNQEEGSGLLYRKNREIGKTCPWLLIGCGETGRNTVQTVKKKLAESFEKKDLEACFRSVTVLFQGEEDRSGNVFLLEKDHAEARENLGEGLLRQIRALYNKEEQMPGILFFSGIEDGEHTVELSDFLSRLLPAPGLSPWGDVPKAGFFLLKNSSQRQLELLEQRMKNVDGNNVLSESPLNACYLIADGDGEGGDRLARALALALWSSDPVQFLTEGAEEAFSTLGCGTWELPVRKMQLYVYENLLKKVTAPFRTAAREEISRREAAAFVRKFSQWQARPGQLLSRAVENRGPWYCKKFLDAVLIQAEREKKQFFSRKKTRESLDLLMLWVRQKALPPVQQQIRNLERAEKLLAEETAEMGGGKDCLTRYLDSLLKKEKLRNSLEKTLAEDIWKQEDPDGFGILQAMEDFFREAGCMDPQDLLLKYVSRNAELDSAQMKKGKMEESQWQENLSAAAADILQTLNTGRKQPLLPMPSGADQKYLVCVSLQTANAWGLGGKVVDGFPNLPGSRAWDQRSLREEALFSCLTRYSGIPREAFWV